MKRLLILCFISSFLFSLGSAVDQKTIINNGLAPVTENISEDYAAVVNSEKITVEEFNDAIKNAKDNLSKQENINFDTEEGQFILSTTKKSIIDDMINNRLIKQQMKKMNIQITDADILEKIKSIKKGFPSEKVFMETLAEEGINEADLKNGIKEQLIVQKIKQELTKKISISEKEIDTFIKHNKEFSGETKRIQLSQIITASKADAEEVLAKLKAGETFDVLAEKYSLDPASKQSGGNIGFIEEGTLDPEAEQVVFALKEGEVSSIILTNEGFSIYKCTQIINADEHLANPREEAKKFLLSKKENEIYEKWLKKIKSEAKININEKIIPKTDNPDPGQKGLPGTNMSNAGA